MRGKVAKAIRQIVYGDNALKTKHQVTYIKNALGQTRPMVVADSVRRYYKMFKKDYSNGTHTNAQRMGLLSTSKRFMELSR
jgi:selenocysteine lyase/cysteine desulfurase